jgi:hypothetical protein
MEDNKPIPASPQMQVPPAPAQSNPNSLNQPSENAPADMRTTAESSQAPQNADNSVPPANVTTIESKKGGKGFGIFVVIGIIAILCIYAYVGYLYFQNQKLKGSTSGTGNQQTSDATITPTVGFNKDYVKVSGGNVIYDDGSGNPKILVDKSNFTSTGITGFIKVSVSPDNQRMCFEAWPPAPTPALYIANVDGSSVSQVNENRKSCLWTEDSNKILYVNIASPVLTSNIYLYDTETKEEKNLTQPDLSVTATKNFELVGLSADGTKAICKYETIGKDEVGQCEIDLYSHEVTYL